MNKENFLARRVCKRKIDELSLLISDINGYLLLVEKNGGVSSKEAHEALSRIIDYKKRLENEEKYISEKIGKLISETIRHRKECNHDILIKELNSDVYYCPFCTLTPSIIQNSIVIEKDKFNGINSEEIYETIEYLIKNNIVLTMEEFVKTLKIVVSEKSYEKVKEMKL